jgi:hypothetical protein
MKHNLKVLSRFDMQEWSQMDAFIANTHGSNHVLRNRPLFEWFFLRNGNEKANIIVAYDGSTLISFLGYLPTRFLWGEGVVDGAWMAHWMTLEGYRSGIGAILMRRITEMFPIVAGQGASQSNKEIVTIMKFKFQERTPKVVGLLNPGRVRTILGVWDYVDYWPIMKSSKLPERRIEISHECYAPDWSQYPSMKFGTLRDAAYLSHRYINYPFMKYEVFLNGPCSSPAVCVVRIVNTALGIRVARVLEFFFPETPNGLKQGETLIKQCIALFLSYDCDYVDFYCTAKVALRLLLEVGFIFDQEGNLPSLLDPIDTSRKFQNWELYISQDLEIRYPEAGNRFYLTRADGDQDRPNESYRGYI